MRRAVQFEQQNDAIALNYTYVERTDRRDLDKNGAVERRRLETWDVTLLEGTPFRRLIARNDKPLSEQEQKEQEARLRQSNDDRRKETPEQREKRISEWKKKRAQQRDGMEEIPEAFDFKIAGEENRRGVDVWVLSGMPRPGFRGKSRGARVLLPNLKCRFWIAKKNYAMVAMELELIDSASLGFILARISQGGRAFMERTLVNNEVWMPSHIEAKATARVLLFKVYRLQVQQDFSAFKKFQADSRIISTEEVK